MTGARILQLLYLLAPAYLANMAPPLVRLWRGWNRPISERLFGPHKTVLGFALGVGTAIVTTFVQSHLPWTWLEITDYERWLSLGLLLGVGALAGDCVKSYFKRRRGRPPGSRWMPFDQLDFVTGALVAVWHRTDLGAADVAVVLAGSFVGHVAVSRVGFWLGVKDVPW